MNVTRETVANMLGQYLRHSLALGDLVDWAERAMMEAEFPEADAGAVASVVARLGLADVRAFGLTWDDCETLLKRLGFEARVEIVST